MHVCRYACMHVCMSACMPVCMHACIHACIIDVMSCYFMLCYVLLRYVMLSYICICVILILLIYFWIYLFVYLCIYLFIYLSIYLCIYVCVICIYYIYIYTYSMIYIYIYIYTMIYIYIIYIYMYVYYIYVFVLHIFICTYICDGFPQHRISLYPVPPVKTKRNRPGSFAWHSPNSANQLPRKQGSYLQGIQYPFGKSPISRVHGFQPCLSFGGSSWFFEGPSQPANGTKKPGLWPKQAISGYIWMVGPKWTSRNSLITGYPDVSKAFWTLPQI